MKTRKIVGLGVVAAALIIVAGGCKQRSSTEPGVMEKTGDALSTAAEKTAEAGKATAEAAKDITGKALEKTGETMESAGSAMERTGDDMQK